MKKTLFIILFAAVAIVTSCKKPDYSISIGTDITEESVVITAKNPITINYTITSPTGVLGVDVESSSNIVIKHFPMSETSGIVTASLLSWGENSYVAIKAGNGTNEAEYRLALEMETITMSGPSTLDVAPAGGEVPIAFDSNVDCEILIPADYQSWISLSDQTKVITPRSATLNIAANEDVARSAKVTVRSKSAPELKIIYTIEQAGILNNLVITYFRSDIVAPNLVGTGAEGMIYWGDGYSLTWVENATHFYTDGAREHSIEIHTKASAFEFPNIHGVSKINMKDF